MYERKVLELLLDGVRLDFDAGGGAGDKRLLSVSMKWPRPMIAERLAVKTLGFVGQVADIAQSAWTTRILFKETVQGPFGLDVSLSQPLPGEVIARIMAALGSPLLKLAQSGMGDAMSTAGAALLKTPLEWLVKQAAGKADAKTEASGLYDLDTCDTWKAGERVCVEVPLCATETLYRTTRTRRHGDVEARRKILARAGERCGTAVFSARIYPD